MTKKLLKTINTLNSPFELCLSFDPYKVNENAVKRAAHKIKISGSGITVDSKRRDMSFIYSRRQSIIGAINRIKERFGSKVKLSIVGEI